MLPQTCGSRLSNNKVCRGLLYTTSANHNTVQLMHDCNTGYLIWENSQQRTLPCSLNYHFHDIYVDIVSSNKKEYGRDN